jgi:hypothetical protein
MSGKSRVLGLMAKQEKARIAEGMAELRDVARQKAEAEKMVARLGEALARQGGTPGVRLAAEIMAERAMTAQLLDEAARQKAREAALAERLAEAQARMARMEHRHQTLTEKAAGARRQEAEDRQALRDAALPPRRR